MQSIDQNRQNAPTLIRECVRNCNIQDDENRGNLQVPIWRYFVMTDDLETFSAVMGTAEEKVKGTKDSGGVLRAGLLPMAAAIIVSICSLL